jgi:asparagine synthase (glutamine-hydrolysing)
MHHRGPDDQGISDLGFQIAGLENLHRRDAENAEVAQRGSDSSWSNGTPGSLAIGMTRLSIIDIDGGHQPVFNEDGQVGAVLNGEIYNFQELGRQLEDRGHTIRTRSDSEVVVHAYEEWGERCVERFEGMFAIAVWDKRQAEKARNAGEGARGPSEGATLFLARDRLGIKPLYYHSKIGNPKRAIPDSFLFASEVRTLLASGVVPRQLSKTAVESYLLFGSVGEPMTLIEGVFSIPPGHRVTIKLAEANDPIRPESYWSIADAHLSEKDIGSGVDLRSNGDGSVPPDAAQAAKQVRELLTESVRKHLIADVPVGVFLSSGIDSTVLAALASRESAGVHTFTVAFPEKEFSEADIARRTAATFGTTHQELMLSGDEMLARLSEAVGALDQPSMDGINTYFVSWGAAQARLKVTLSGLGGDEVFGGYNTFRRTAHFQRLANLGSNLPRGLRAAVGSAVTGAGRHFVSRDAARKLTALLSSRESMPDAFYFGRTLFTPSQVTALFGSHRPNGATPLWRTWLAETALHARTLDPFAAVTCMEARSYLVNTLLRDTDSMSMAHSLEVRVPFLDHPLVEFVIRLPQALKLRKGSPKSLLVEALSDLLPAEVVEQKKRGFTFPWSEWLRGPLKTRVENGLSELSPALREVLDAKETRRVWQDYLDGKTSWSRPWSLYVLNEWSKAHL